MKSLELIVNGAVVSTRTPTGNEKELTLDEEARVGSSGWLAVRCVSGNSSFPGGQFLSAHSNPIYVEMPLRPLDARADAAYFLAWIDRLDEDLRKRGRLEPGLDHVKMQLETARAVYARLRGAATP